jgi:hypothetical protein
MCPNLYMLYYGEDANLIECKTYKHAQYKPNNDKERIFDKYKTLR